MSSDPRILDERYVRPKHDFAYKELDNPSVPPDEPPFHCVKIREDWLPIILGALYRLTFEDTYKGEPADQALASQRGHEVLQQFAEGVMCAVYQDLRENDCVLEGLTEGGTWEEIMDVKACVTQTCDCPGTGLSEEEKGEPTGEEEIIHPTGNCDPDKLYGVCRAIVDWFDTGIVQLLDTIEVGTNLFELIAAILDNFPGFENMPGTVLLEYVTWLQDTLKENYSASFTPVLRDKIICDLFCLFIDTCSAPSISDVTQYYQDQVVSGGNPFIPVTGFEDWVEALVAGEYTGDQTVYAAHLSYLAVFQIGRFFGNRSGVRSWQQTVALGALNPSADWQVLCTQCNPWVLVPRTWGIVTENEWHNYHVEATVQSLNAHRVKIGANDGGNFVVLYFAITSGTVTTWINEFPDGTTTGSPPVVGECYSQIEGLRPNGTFEFDIIVARDEECAQEG